LAGAIGYARRVSLVEQHEPSPLRPVPLLSVSDLRIAFSGQEAVRGVSFEIAPGETLGLVGESGSGKSATSLALLRLLPPSAAISGSMRFMRADGAVEELLSLPEEAMRRHRGQSMAMIFQEPMTALNPVMKIGRQIGEALLAHAPRTAFGSKNGLTRREVRERVLAAMREVALPESERRMEDYPHQFSGGQRQRIAIAMALINKPRLLIADEPTTALDVTVQAQILALLRELKSEHHLSMLFISHDLAVVGQVADRVAVMRDGEIVEQGSVAQVLTRPQHEYTRNLLASAPTMSTARDRPLATMVRSGV
jgi:peptide/nickel transport system ATP-binding protein